jgi:predicted DNA-binding protein (UPF0251 family)
MPCSEYRCPVGACMSPVADPLVPCRGCLAAFGPRLRMGSEPSEAETAALLACSEAKAARAATTPAVRCLPRRQRPAASPWPSLSGEELTEEAVHLVWWCGFSREEAAGRLGVGRLVLEAALRRAKDAA